MDEQIFRQRVEAIFGPDFYVGEYREHQGEEGSGPFVEFSVRLINKSWEKAYTYISVAQMKKLEELMKPQDLSVTGFDLGNGGEEDEVDHLIYVLATRPTFEEKPRPRVVSKTMPRKKPRGE